MSTITVYDCTAEAGAVDHLIEPCTQWLAFNGTVDLSQLIAFLCSTPGLTGEDRTFIVPNGTSVIISPAALALLEATGMHRIRRGADHA